jgi:hypothetical protein
MNHIIRKIPTVGWGKRDRRGPYDLVLASERFGRFQEVITVHIRMILVPKQ